MDLVDLIAEKQFIGQEFLTWLWFKSEERGGTICLPDSGDIQLVFEKHMLLESGEGESNERLICKGLQTELVEARTGLQVGKKLEQARIFMAKGEYEWRFSLTGGLGDFRNLKVPKTMAAGEESNDPAAIEGRILERIALIEDAYRTVDEMFKMFLLVRISEEWTEEVKKVNSWINKDIR
jgi:hypothetical protein